jgi:hypothetical protein
VTIKKTSRHKFLKYVSILLLVAAVVLAGFTLFYMPIIRNQAIINLMHHKTEQTVSQFNEFIRPVVTNLSVLLRWGEDNILDYYDVPELNRLLLPVFDEHLPQVSGLMMADSRGLLYNLSRSNGEWVNLSVPPEYDAQLRPWFQGVLSEGESGEIFWSEAFRFSTHDMYGIAASVSYRVGDEAEKRYVIALKIALEDIENMLEGMPLGNSGRLLLIQEDSVRDLVEFGRRQQPFDKVTPTASRHITLNPEIALGISTWKEASSHTGKALSFVISGKRWWIEVSPSLTSGESFIGVMLPDNVLQKEAGRFNFLFLIGLLGFLIFLLLLVLVFLRRYSRQTEAMLDQKRFSEASEEEIVTLINEGESSELEFKSTLRWNLKTDKPDKSVEFATLKTIVAFLNSDGGTLLVGVKDNGEILGIEKDNFANEDKLLLHFNNLIKQHIGLEFAQHIYFAIKSVDERKILVVDCEESEDPAFLKHDGGEDFYVRVGPGSRKLPTSKVLEYLKNQDSL